ncbi:hypothetical protein F5Y19DRAFT_477630 [Xylariaceae sp. FL1651]|nr:hypothetical protein F5Y19DRAFT_477630 [Xylariaceae sp. FL1651]
MFDDYDTENQEPFPLGGDDDPFSGINFSVEDNPDFEQYLENFGPLLSIPSPSPKQQELEANIEADSHHSRYVNFQEVHNIPLPDSLPQQSFLPTAGDFNVDPSLLVSQQFQPQTDPFNYDIPYDSRWSNTLIPTTVPQASFPGQPYGRQLGIAAPAYPEYQNPGYLGSKQFQYQPCSVPLATYGVGRSSFLGHREGTLPSTHPPSPHSVTTISPTLKRDATDHHGRPLKNGKIPRKTHRNKGPEAVEPELYYGPSPPKPKSWGPKNKKGEYLFTYTEKGELAPGKFFTKLEMRYYLLGPSKFDNFEGPQRLPGVKRIRQRTREGLTLWIGWPAAMANVRYPRHGESTKCRFQDCQYARTIAAGQPWVILDERQNVKGEVVDPFHNAGYVHLYCLEYHFDILDLWKFVDLRYDQREFKREEYSYFNITRNLPGITNAIDHWWRREIKARRRAKVAGEKRHRRREVSLDACLVAYKLEQEPKAQQQARKKRGGLDMSKHLGDPEKKRFLQACKRHGLLDDQGNPIVGADEQLQAIENANKRGRNGSKAADTGDDSPPLAPSMDLQPTFDPVARPAPDQTAGVQPVIYGTDLSHYASPVPIQPSYVPVDIAFLDQLGQPSQPVLEGFSATQAPRLAAETAGYKRSRDETAVEDGYIAGGTGATQNAPAPKRQRLEDGTSKPLNVDDQNTAMLANNPNSDPNIDSAMQDVFPDFVLNNDAIDMIDIAAQSNPELEAEFEAAFLSRDLAGDLNDDDLNQFFGTPEAAEIDELFDDIDGTLVDGELHGQQWVPGSPFNDGPRSPLQVDLQISTPASPRVNRSPSPHRSVPQSPPIKQER